ncbi:hypothetical protein C7A10_25800 [Pseudomonas fluorescens]|uniref:Uncharacterized protein n=1 Tax=Pseudomonas fluorescens TaxID=294 RepID=A0A2T0HSE6_PSEFL|nr:hypothetical protein C7A10_25800 [Pseudomonas fluorescens]
MSTLTPEALHKGRSWKQKWRMKISQVVERYLHNRRYGVEPVARELAPVTACQLGHTYLTPRDQTVGGLGRHSGFSKVTRCQSGTLRGRYRRNGDVPNPTVLTVRPHSRASPLPQFDRGASGR